MHRSLVVTRSLVVILSTLGKVIGGGLPVGAYGGRRDIMEMVAPSGPVYQAGTLAGNPLAMTAGIETLRELQAPGVWEVADNQAGKLADGLRDAARAAGVPAVVQRVGTMFTTFFAPGPVVDWATAKAADTAQYAAFFRAMLASGIYLAPSQFEASFLSAVHGASELDATLLAAKQALRFELGATKRV